MEANLSRQKALDFLEEIQKQCLISRFGPDFEEQLALFKGEGSADSDNTLERLSSETDEEYSKFKEEYYSDALLTKYEVRHSFIILKTLFEKVENTLKQFTNEKLSMPYIGTAHSREYNAFAIKVPTTDEYLIIFEGELFMLANLLSKIIVLSMPDLTDRSFSLDREKLRSWIEGNPTLTERFRELIEYGMFRGEPSKCSKYRLSENLQLTLQFQLLQSMELFVVAHEIGHLYNGDLNNSATSILHIKNNSYDKILPAWEMEYEADRFGLNLLLHIVGKEGIPPFSYLGPELFFSFLSIDERTRNVEGNQAFDGNDTHPPSFERRTRIRKALNELLPQDHLESYSVVSQFLEDILEIHWDNYKAKFN
jgi:hypothetical protein